MSKNLLIAFVFLTFKCFSQNTGPGGVGNATDLSVWLDASSISVSDGSNINNWDDISGNNNNFTQSSAPLKPIFTETSSIGAKPAVQFYSDHLVSSSISSLNTSNQSWFLVHNFSNPTVQVLFRSNYTSGSSSSLASSQLLGVYSSSTDGIKQYVRASNGNIKANTQAAISGSHISSSVWSSTTLSSFTDNTLVSNISTGSVSPSGHNLVCLGANSTTPSDNFLPYIGQIAEFILFNTDLNNAQRIIVNNYLSSKYSISIGDDKYSFDTNHGYEVTGIGREDISNQHLNSRGKGIIQVQANSLDNSDYFIWGHDNGNLTSTSSGIPSSFPSTSGKILERQWRVNETGESGDLTITVDLTGIGFGAESDYKLLIDSDGDFTSGATVIDGSYNSNLVTFTVLSSEFSNGDYFTIGNTSIEIKSISSGNWTTTSVWDCSCEPTLANDVTIESGHNISVSSSVAVNNLTVTGTLSLANLIDVEGNITNNGTITNSSGARIFVGGNWNNNSSSSNFTACDSVTFDGTANPSTITGNTDWGILTLNNTNGVTINSGNQNIFEKLNIKNGALTTGGLITLKSSQNGTAQMDNIETGSVSGNITIERYLDLTAKDGWREVTSPLQGSTLQDWQQDGVIFSGFSGSDYPTYSFISAYTYNEPSANGVADDGWTSPTNITNPVSATNGHRIYFDSLAYTLTTSGSPNTGTQIINVTQNGGGGNADQQNGWNLIGNPYPCTIDWSKLSSGDRNNIENSIWIFNQTSGNYGVWNGSSGTLGVDNKIASSQAFWVHATSNTGSVTFNEEDKIIDDKAFIKSFQMTEEIKIRLSGDINSYYDEVAIKRLDSATSSFDYKYDLLKLFTDIPDYAPSLYSIIDDSLFVSVNCINKNNNTEIVFNAEPGDSAHGNYNLDFTIPELFMQGGCLFLTDLQLDSTIDLRQNNSYSFTTNDSINPRFKLNIFRDYDVNVVGSSCYSSNDGQVIIDGDSIIGSTFDLLDSNGTLINSQIANSNIIYFNGLYSNNYTISSDLNNTCNNNISEVQVQSPNPIISNFSMNKDTIYLGFQPAQLQLTNLSFGYTNSDWDFGDNYYSNETHPVHFYSDTGLFDVALSVVDSNFINCTSIFEKAVLVVDSSSISALKEKNDEININFSNSNLNINSLININLLTINIYNTLGQIIYNNNLSDLGLGNHIINLPLKQEKLYFANVIIDEKIYTIKFYMRD